MAFLTRRQGPIEDLFDFRRDFDSIFNRLLSNRSETSMERTSIPPIQAWIDNEKKAYRLRVALPGVSPNEVQINVQGNTITIGGEHRTGGEKEQGDFLQREFSFTRFERTIVLPDGVDPSKANADYNNGVLEINAPLSEAAVPRRIEIKTSEGAKAARA